MDQRRDGRKATPFNAPHPEGPETAYSGSVTAVDAPRVQIRKTDCHDGPVRNC